MWQATKVSFIVISKSPCLEELVPIMYGNLQPYAAFSIHNWIAYLMARLIWNPTKYSKLVQEIRTAFEHEDEITYEAMTDLEYLNACIKRSS